MKSTRYPEHQTGQTILHHHNLAFLKATNITTLYHLDQISKIITRPACLAATLWQSDQLKANPPGSIRNIHKPHILNRFLWADLSNFRASLFCAALCIPLQASICTLINLSFMCWTWCTKSESASILLGSKIDVGIFDGSPALKQRLMLRR